MTTGYEAGYYRAVDSLARDVRRIADALEELVKVANEDADPVSADVSRLTELVAKHADVLKILAEKS